MGNDAFRDEFGWPCGCWKGMPCDQAEKWFYSEAGKLDIMHNCLGSCAIASSLLPQPGARRLAGEPETTDATQESENAKADSDGEEQPEEEKPVEQSEAEEELHW